MTIPATNAPVNPRNPNFLLQTVWHFDVIGHFDAAGAAAAGGVDVGVGVVLVFISWLNLRLWIRCNWNCCLYWLFVRVNATELLLLIWIDDVVLARFTVENDCLLLVNILLELTLVVIGAN